MKSFMGNEKIFMAKFPLKRHWGERKNKTKH